MNLWKGVIPSENDISIKCLDEKMFSTYQEILGGSFSDVVANMSINRLDSC